MWSQLAASLQHGDAYIYIILALAFIGTVVLFERIIMLQFIYHIDFAKFVDNLKKMILAEDLDRAINFCKKASNTSLPRISRRALEAAEADPTTIKGTIEEETIDFLPKLENRLGVIPALSTLIFLIGILGTIDSLWQTFEAVDVLDTAQKQASVADGVAGSLNYTALGLIVCMLFLTGHQMLRGMAIKLTDRIHYGVAVLNNLLVPPEVAAYAPAAPMPVAAADSLGSQEFVPEAAPQPVQEAEANENFSDTSVEDIKDEEEII